MSKYSGNNFFNWRNDALKELNDQQRINYIKLMHRNNDFLKYKLSLYDMAPIYFIQSTLYLFALD